MTKKDLGKVQADLSALAGNLPSQNVVRTEPVKPRAAPIASEEITQFSLSLRKSLRKELGRLADDVDMTMRAFVLLALKDKGLSVTDDDLKDLRKERGGG